MQAINREFTKIVNGTTQFVIPVFQRDYTWSEAQCLQLWQDILSVADGEPGRGHFLGSVVYIATGDSSAGFTRWLLIDGQQRVTTLTILLVALRDHIKDTGWQGDNEDAPTAKRINAYFLQNTEEEGTRESKLVLRRHDEDTLRALVKRQTRPADASARLVDNYEFFREQIADADPAAVYAGVGKLVVVDVTLDRKTDDPQLIFESLNSTGVDLSQSDLIRNYILMRLPEADQTRLYEDHWRHVEGLFRGSEATFDAFLRDYVALKTKANKQEKASEVYRAFRRFFPDFVSQSEDLDDALADLRRYAEYYAAFSLDTAVGVLRAPLSQVRRLVDVAALLVMRLSHCHYREGTLTESDFVHALKLIESYIFRRAICGYQTRGYWQVFAKLAHGLDTANPLVSLKVGLARQPDSYVYPDDEEYGRELRERNLYGLRVCSYLLERLENHGTKEPTDTSGYSIEHIMPQNEQLLPAWRKALGDNWKEIQQAWLHRLGNLTLTGYNSTYSDRSFADKKTIKGGFAESSVRLNKYVREQETWATAEMEARGKQLAKRALEIWPMLGVSAEALAAAREAELKALAARSDVSKVKMTDKAGELAELLRVEVKALGSDVHEIAEPKSISYHGPHFFLELLPRKHQINLLLPLAFNEIDDPHDIAQDATQWKFFFHAKYGGGVLVSVAEEDDIPHALPLIQQALTLGA
ncbi:MAG: DUF262 domain-containing protein [Lentisphaerae bacterium]|nr:DUF262 domain-containing protein [Lentisphaerota bacterium]